jgi:hypothetical protein
MVYNGAMPPDSPQPDQQPQYQGIPPVSPENSPSHPQAYDFIVNPAAPAKHSSSLGLPSLPSSNSKAIRMAYVAVGILILIILFVIVKGIVVGKPNFTSFVKVAQDQQQLISIASGVSSNNSTSSTAQQSLSTGNLNLAATVNLSISSDQSRVLSYLSKNHFKTSSKTLDLGVSNSVNTELTNAQTSGTYNQVFQQVIISSLNSYISDLNGAYNGAGKNGKVILHNDYIQAKLLLTSANSPTNAITN